MRRLSLSQFILCLVVVSLAAPSLAIVRGQAPAANAAPIADFVDPQPRAQAADAALTKLASDGFSGVVLVAKDGVTILRKGYGLANRAAGTPMSATTVVPIGSNTKDFTLVSLLQLVERGKVGLDDPITKYFPGVPADKRAITVRNLMSHTAGFEQHLGGDYEPLTRADEIARALASRLLFAPGGGEQYSNIGFSLLAAIIEQVSHTSYDEYVRDNILEPIGMSNTGVLLPHFDLARLSRGYADGVDRGMILERPLAADGPYWNLRGNGGMLSTMDDMLMFYRELFNGEKLMSPATRAIRFRPGEAGMMMGSDRVHTFAYNRRPPAGFDIFVYTNTPELTAPRVLNVLTTALGLNGPGAGRAGGPPVVNGQGRQGAPQIVTSTGPPAGRGGQTVEGGGPGAIPDTPAGRKVREFLPARLDKNPVAIRKFVETQMTAGLQSDTAIDRQVNEILREYTEHGYLTPLDVNSSVPDRIVVRMRSVMTGPVKLTLQLDPATSRVKSIRID